MALTFEWDPEKAKTNARKHGVTFEEASTLFRDELSVTVPDPDHSRDEDRFLIVGHSTRGRAMIVAHVERSGRVRIISARLLLRAERIGYEEKS